LNIKPLLFLPSAREIPQVKEAVDKLNIDKLWVKNYNQQEAYKLARIWFLEHKYTHLIINPDDLIVKQQDIDQLVKSTQVISGWCVHGKSPPERNGLDSNVSFKHLYEDIIPGALDYNYYEFIPIADIKDDITKVGFSGFAPTVIPRRIVKKIPFRTSYGCCVDSCFSQDLTANKIPQYVDFRVKTIEIEATDPELLQVGKKEKEIIFVPS